MRDLREPFRWVLVVFSCFFELFSQKLLRDKVGQLTSPKIRGSPFGFSLENQRVAFWLL